MWRDYFRCLAKFRFSLGDSFKGIHFSLLSYTFVWFLWYLFYFKIKVNYNVLSIFLIYLEL